MKKLTLFLVFFAFPIITLGQSAKVIALSTADAEEAKSLYAQQEVINKKIEALQERIKENYLKERASKPKPNTICFSSSGCYWSVGWETGEFLFSDDFKFIVPKPFTTPTTSSGSIFRVSPDYNIINPVSY